MNESTIELRSDTLTVPGPEMRSAIAEAEVGDDVYGEDPTVGALEAESARLVGQQAACFVPSGTMANLCAVLAQVPRGRSVIVGDRSDLGYFEAGGPSVLGGVVLRPVHNLPDGRLCASGLEHELRLDRADYQFAVPAMISVETAHNMCGGAVLPMDYLHHLRVLADQNEVALHIDGARIFNAAFALGVPADEIGAVGDSVQFCLSKGLGAPVGSMIAGPSRTVERVRRVRKMLGGGMRQAGLLAAAGRVALRAAEQTLRQDHEHASMFAGLLAGDDGVVVENSHPETNIVFFDVAADVDRVAFLEGCRQEGVNLIELETGRIRAVFHNGISSAATRSAAATISEVASGCRFAPTPDDRRAEEARR